MRIAIPATPPPFDYNQIGHKIVNNINVRPKTSITYQGTPADETPDERLTKFLDGWKSTRRNTYAIKHAQRKYKLYPENSGAIKCGLYPLPQRITGKPELAELSMKTIDAKKYVTLGNLRTCKSCWSCPTCRAYITSWRSAELDRLVHAWSAKGLVTHMITLTFRHQRYDKLSSLIGSSKSRLGLAGAWARLTESRSWKNFVKDENLFGYIRATEVTHGKNGFHPHLHILFFFDRIALEPEIITLKVRKYLFDEWKKALSKSNLNSNISWENGVNVIPVKDGWYLQKWSIGSEMSSIADIVGRKGSLSIAQIEQAMLEGERYRMERDEALPLLRDYYETMAGSPPLRYSNHPDFRDFCEPHRIEEDTIFTQTEGEILCYIYPADLIKFAQKSPSAIADLKTAIETGGMPRASLMLKKMGIDADDFFVQMNKL